MRTKRTLFFIALIFTFSLGHSQWNPIGSFYGTGSSMWYKVATDPFGTPYVLYSEEDDMEMEPTPLTMMKLVNNQWTTVGAAQFGDGTGSDFDLSIDQQTGTPYVAYGDRNYDDAITVMHFDGVNWIALGGRGFTAPYCSQPSIALLHGQPYISFQDNGAGGRVSVMRWNGMWWEYVGTPGFTPSYGQEMQLTISTTGLIYVAYRDWQIGKLSVMYFDGYAWQYAGYRGISAGNVGDVTAASGINGEIFVSYQDQAYGNRVTVQKFDGYSGWSNVGSPGFTSNLALFPRMNVDNQGKPWVVYGDYYNGYRPLVYKFDQGTWWPIGSYLTPDYSGGVEIAFTPAGLPVVALLDGMGSLVVTKYASSTLPLSITGIQGSRLTNGSVIEWNVEGQQGISHYQVERSANGTDFANCGSVSATTAERDNYRWTDIQAPSGNVYYRVKAIASTGHVTYSAVVKITVANESTITAYPNPVTNRQLQLQFGNSKPGNYQVEMFAADGRKVLTTKVKISGNNAVERIALPSTVKAGIYQVRVSVDSRSVFSTQVAVK